MADRQLPMYTQCPKCEAVFSIAQDQLDHRDGLVRCGACMRVYDATASLYDEIPAAPSVHDADIIADGAAHQDFAVAGNIIQEEDIDEEDEHESTLGFNTDALIDEASAQVPDKPAPDSEHAYGEQVQLESLQQTATTEEPPTPQLHPSSEEIKPAGEPSLSMQEPEPAPQPLSIGTEEDDDDDDEVVAPYSVAALAKMPPPQTSMFGSDSRVTFGQESDSVSVTELTGDESEEVARLARLARGEQPDKSGVSLASSVATSPTHDAVPAKAVDTQSIEINSHAGNSDGTPDEATAPRTDSINIESTELDVPVVATELPSARVEPVSVADTGLEFNAPNESIELASLDMDSEPIEAVPLSPQPTEEETINASIEAAFAKEAPKESELPELPPFEPMDPQPELPELVDLNEPIADAVDIPLDPLDSDRPEVSEHMLALEAVMDSHASNESSPVTTLNERLDPQPTVDSVDTVTAPSLAEQDHPTLAPEVTREKSGGETLERLSPREVQTLADYDEDVELDDELLSRAGVDFDVDVDSELVSELEFVAQLERAGDDQLDFDSEDFIQEHHARRSVEHDADDTSADNRQSAKSKSPRNAGSEYAVPNINSAAVEAKPASSFSKWLPRVGLAAACVTLVATLLWQAKSYYLDDLAQVPALRPLLSTVCNWTGCELAARISHDQMSLIATYIDAHPEQPNALRIATRITNSAGFAQPYPDVRLTMTDKRGRVVARRDVSPQEYLAVGDVDNAVIAAGETEQVFFDLMEPRDDAFGYEVELLNIE